VLYNPGEDGDHLDVCILNIHLNNALNIRLGTRNIDTKKNPYKSIFNMDRPRFRWVVPILITVGFTERNKMLYNRSEKKTVNTIFLCGQRYRD